MSSVEKPGNENIIPSQNSDQRTPPKFPIRSREEEAEARCLAQIHVGFVDMDHSAADAALKTLPDQQIHDFDTSLKQRLRRLLAENAVIIDKYNPTAADKE